MCLRVCVIHIYRYIYIYIYIVRLIRQFQGVWFSSGPHCTSPYMHTREIHVALRIRLLRHVLKCAMIRVYAQKYLHVVFRIFPLPVARTSAMFRALDLTQIHSCLISLLMQAHPQANPHAHTQTHTHTHEHTHINTFSHTHTHTHK